MVADLSLGLTRPQAAAAPKLFQLNRTLGPAVVIKLLVVVLKCFVDSVRVPDKMSAAELIETAELLATTYTHDSVKDITLALKEARLGGYKFYQSVDTSKVCEIVAAYFDRKAKWLQDEHLDQKAKGGSHDVATVQVLGELAPKMLENVAQRIPASHPNHDSIRRKLSLTNARARRGLITPEEAERQRAEARAATYRKPRPDWQASPEAQQRMDARSREENRRLMARGDE